MKKINNRCVAPVVGIIIIVSLVVVISTVAITSFIVYTDDLEEPVQSYVVVTNGEAEVQNSGNADEIIIDDENGESELEVGQTHNITGEYAIYGYRNNDETLLKRSDGYTRGNTTEQNEESEEENYNFNTEPDDLDEILSNMSGDGSTTNPYVITNIYELQAIDADLNSHYVLGTDIDASYTESWSNGFDPIGDSSGTFNSDAFDGSLDGQRYTINGLTIDRSTEDRTALFSGIGSGATIEHMTIRSATVNGNTRTAVLIGESWGDVSNIGVEDSTVNGDERVGGLIANANGGFRADSIIQHTYVTDTSITGSDRVGGIVGRNYQGDILSSYSTDMGVVGDHDSGFSTTVSNIYYEDDNVNSIGIELTQSQMQGSSAETNMPELFPPFETTDEYPKLNT